MSLFIKLLLDCWCLIFPAYCMACKRLLHYGEKYICTHCLYDLPFTDFHLYPDNAAAKTFWGRIRCTAAVALFYFSKGSKVQQLVHGLKYKGYTGLGHLLGRLLAEKLQHHPGYCTADMLIPVPLHPRRAARRGYNQSCCIAAGLSAVLHIPVYDNLLIRRKAAASQTKKNRYTRYADMADAFDLHKKAPPVSGLHLVLVDDVITTGATLEACARKLLAAGAGKISIAALAFTEKK